MVTDALPEVMFEAGMGRLAGSLPPGRVFPKESLASGAAFAAMDGLLAQARFGPTYLRRNDVASLVAEAIRHGEVLANYELHACVVMTNHVHMLITPVAPVPRLVRMLKNVVTIQANRILE